MGGVTTRNMESSLQKYNKLYIVAPCWTIIWHSFNKSWFLHCLPQTIVLKFWIRRFDTAGYLASSIHLPQVSFTATFLIGHSTIHDKFPKTLNPDSYKCSLLVSHAEYAYLSCHNLPWFNKEAATTRHSNKKKKYFNKRELCVNYNLNSNSRLWYRSPKRIEKGIGTICLLRPCIKPCFL
jgi:hypothetical protein